MKHLTPNQSADIFGGTHPFWNMVHQVEDLLNIDLPTPDDYEDGND